MIPDELKNEITLTKTSKNTANAEYFSAFDNEDTLTVTLKAPREAGISSPYAEFYRDDDNERFELFFTWTGRDKRDPYKETYTLVIKTSNICRFNGKEYASGLFYYSIVINSAYGRYRISRRYDSYSPRIENADDPYDAFQLTVYEKVYAPVKGFSGGIMYHIFVDRFCKGGNFPIRQDALLNEDWENGVPQYASERGGFVENNMFFGGTLKGVESKLDYLASLGVNIIYLSPIFEAYSNHKYDTGRYDRVDAMFGGDGALEDLIKSASQKGIKIILDMVFNHTGSDSMYFNKKGRYDTLGAYQSKESPYYGWYDFESYPDRYRCWWGVDILPAVRTEEKSYDRYINGEDGIVKKYLKKGVSGYRLDVADELSPIFLENLTSAVKSENPNALIIGEVWEDASCKIAYDKRRRYFRGRQIDSVMNYPLRQGIIEFVKNKNNSALFKASVTLYQNYPKFVSDNLMNFLGTHDTERILTVLGTDGEEGMSADLLARYKMSESQRKKALEMLKNAYVLLAFMPGIPCIYYGDEAGMEGFRDPFNRMPYIWGREDASLISHYRKIGKIRREHEAFCSGYYKVIEGTPQGVFCFLRIGESEKIAVCVNCGTEGYLLNISGESLNDGKRQSSFDIPCGSYDIILQS